MLIISFRPDNDVSSMGCVVDHFSSELLVHYCTSDEEAVEHVANINARNDYEASDFQHLFVYHGNDCPEGGVIMQDIANLNMGDTYSCIPEHLIELVKRRTAARLALRKEEELRKQELDKIRREEEQRKDDLRMFEHLRKKLGQD